MCRHWQSLPKFFHRMYFAVFRHIVRHQCFFKNSATYAVLVQHIICAFSWRIDRSIHHSEAFYRVPSHAIIMLFPEPSNAMAITTFFNSLECIITTACDLSLTEQANSKLLSRVCASCN